MRTATADNSHKAKILTQIIIERAGMEKKKIKVKIKVKTKAIIPIQNITEKNKISANKIKAQTEIRTPNITRSRAVRHGETISR